MMSGKTGFRDGFDPDGRLVLDDGTEVDIHEFSRNEWAALEASGRHGVGWKGEHANWSRFINHASDAHQNVSICTDSIRFGKSHGLYAKRAIAAGEELFFSYGKGYWDSRGIKPEDPADE